MNSRERVTMALNHQEPDRVPLDLGASAVTGMQVSSVYLLRQALKLDPPGTPVKVVEPYQMLGEIAPDLMDALGVDVVGLGGRKNLFGFRNEGWKPWTLFDGTPVLVPEGFNTDPEPDGSILMYPEGDRAAPPSGHMPAGGYYFDTIIRQEPIDDAKLNPEDNLEEFGPISDDDLAYFAQEAERLFDADRQGHPRQLRRHGLRRHRARARPVAETSQGHPRRGRVVHEHGQPAGLRVEGVRAAVRDRAGEPGAHPRRRRRAGGGGVRHRHRLRQQHGPFISRKAYRDLFMPFHRAVNDWIHENTTWKSFIHSCGSVISLMPDFIEAGFDILNPVQTSAAHMDPQELKTRFGQEITFWGGGVDTQRTLPFGTPDEVRAEVRERMRIFGAGGGFVFNTIHNVQARVPAENLLALYEAVQDFGGHS